MDSPCGEDSQHSATSTHKEGELRLNKHIHKAVLAAALALIGGLAVAGCSNKGGGNNNGSLTTNGQSILVTVNNLGSSIVPMNANTSLTYTLSVSLRDGAGNVTSLSNTAYTLSVSSSNPSIVEVSKDSQNTVILASKGINGDAAISIVVGYQGGRGSPQPFTVRVSGGSGNNNPNQPSNPNFTISVTYSKTMPVNVNENVDITVFVTQTGVSGSTQLTSNQYNVVLLNNPNNIGVVQVKDTNRWEFRGNNNTGEADVKIDVISFNNQSFSQTFVAPIKVTLNGGGGTGNNAGTVYNNIVIASGSSPSTGVASPISVQADKGAGLVAVTMNNERIYARPNQADVDAGRIVMDADGNMWFNVSGATIDIQCIAMGPVQNLGTAYQDERWNVGTVSNTLQLQASGNIPQTKLLFRYVRGSASLGLMKLGVFDPQTGSDVAANAQAAGGLTFSDSNAFEYVNATDDAGVTSPHLKIKKFGRFWVQATYNGRTTDKFYVLVTPYGDLMVKEGSRFVFDTHVSAARPFRNPSNSAQRKLGVLVNLTRCGAGNIAQQSLFLEDVGNGTGKTMPTMQVSDDTKFTDQSDGTVWGLYYFVYAADSGSQDIADFNYLGSGPNPFDPAAGANKWPQDTVFSRFWSGSISSNGVFRARVFKDPAMSKVTLEARP